MILERPCYAAWASPPARYCIRCSPMSQVNAGGIDSLSSSRVIHGIPHQGDAVPRGHAEPLLVVELPGHAAPDDRQRRAAVQPVGGLARVPPRHLKQPRPVQRQRRPVQDDVQPEHAAAQLQRVDQRAPGTFSIT